MRSLRSWLGLNDEHELEMLDNIERKKQVKQERQQNRGNYNERAQERIRHAHNVIGGLQDELEELDENIQIAAQRNDSKAVKGLLIRKRAAQRELAQEKAQLQNVERTFGLVRQGQSNLVQAELTIDAADHLKELNEQMEILDVDDAVDDLRSESSRITDAGRLLSEPIMDVYDEFGQDDIHIDDELNEIMAQARTSALDNLSVPNRNSNPEKVDAVSIQNTQKQRRKE